MEAEVLKNLLDAAKKQARDAGKDKLAFDPQGRVLVEVCAGHGVELGGESPLRAELRRFVSLGKGVHREVGSEGS